jgi:hypothetical protein
MCAALLMCATIANAQQTLNFTLGYFTPLALDARDHDDVLLENSTFLLFDPDDFNGASVGGEWLFPLARVIEGGIGVSYMSQDAHSVYFDFVRSGRDRDRSGTDAAHGADRVHRASRSHRPTFAGAAVYRRRSGHHQLALRRKR